MDGLSPEWIAVIITIIVGVFTTGMNVGGFAAMRREFADLKSDVKDLTSKVAIKADVDSDLKDVKALAESAKWHGNQHVERIASLEAVTGLRASTPTPVPGRPPRGG